MTTILERDPVTDLALSLEMNGAIDQSTHPVYAFLSIQGDSNLEVDTDGMSREALYLHQLGLKLAQRGCHVDIFVRREHPDQPEVVEHQPGCRTIRLTAGPVMVLARSQVLEYLPAFVDAWLTFQRRSNRHYVLFQTIDWLSGWAGLQLKKRLDLPLVHTSRAIGALKCLWLESSKVLSVRYSMERTCLEQADCIVTGSPQEAAAVRRMILIQGQSKVIPWGIDTQHFGSLSQAGARQQLGIPPETRLILYVGELAPLKSLETLVRACAFLPTPFQLYLVSNRSEKAVDVKAQQQLRDLVQQMNIEDCVVFMTQVSQAHLPAYYAAANVCVVPDYNEASSSVLLEAMASGTPIIASAIASAVDELRYVMGYGQAGLLVPPFNPDALAAALWDVWANPNHWYRYAVAGRQWVMSRFSYNAVSRQMHDLYRALTVAETVKASSPSKHLASIADRKLHQLAGSK